MRRPTDGYLTIVDEERERCFQNQNFCTLAGATCHWSNVDRGLLFPRDTAWHISFNMHLRLFLSSSRAVLISPYQQAILPLPISITFGAEFYRCYPRSRCCCLLILAFPRALSAISNTPPVASSSPLSTLQFPIVFLLPVVSPFTPFVYIHL
jgi:hypothetical protein